MVNGTDGTGFSMGNTSYQGKINYTDANIIQNSGVNVRSKINNISIPLAIS